MKRPRWVPVFALLFAGLLGGAWMCWPEEPSESAWIVDHPEQIVSGAKDQEHRVRFIIRNISSRPLRVLGVEAC